MDAMTKHNDILAGWRTPVALAPMAGVTDRVFRRICRAFGSGAAYTPMISAKSILFENEATYDLMRSDEDETALALQLFGHEPDDIAEALRRADLRPYAWIDLNMGCPAPKITRQGEGSALMRDLPRAEALIRAAVKASPLPVSVKFRKGWDERSVNAVAFAKMAQDAGARMLCVHPRTSVQMYAGSADWNVLEQVARAVCVPVVASGDICDAQSARRALQMGCAAVMIGRASFGDPWIFAHVAAELSDQAPPPEPTQAQRLAMALVHARMLTEDMDEHVAMLQMRKHAAWYVRGIQGVGALRASIYRTTRLQQLCALLDAFAATHLSMRSGALTALADTTYEGICGGPRLTIQ